MEAFNNLGEEKNCETFLMDMFCMCYLSGEHFNSYKFISMVD